MISSISAFSISSIAIAYSKLHHTTYPDLFLVKASRYQRTSFSLLKGRSALAIHSIVRLFPMQFEECQEDFRTR